MGPGELSRPASSAQVRRSRSHTGWGTVPEPLLAYRTRGAIKMGLGEGPGGRWAR